MLANYYVEVCDYSGVRLAIFDSWMSLEYSKRINNIGYFVMKIDLGDSRRQYFVKDYFVKLFRALPGSVDWYVDFVGQVRFTQVKRNPDGSKYFEARGFGLLDLLRRRRVGYKAGTVQADKDANTETVMKEYVNENCGPIATVANGRLISGVYPYFTVDADLGAGVEWYGSRAYEVVLDVLQELSLSGSIDFDVIVNGSLPNLMFKTYNGQLGTDRTYPAVTADGKNAAGNVPVVFNYNLANVAELAYTDDGTGEYTVCHVLGEGDGSTRTVKTVASSAYSDTPYNAIETVVNGTGQEFEYQLLILGAEVLASSQAVESFEFSPLRNPQTLYGKDFELGDKVTLVDGTIKRNKRLVAMKSTISAPDVEKLSFEFADVP